MKKSEGKKQMLYKFRVQGLHEASYLTPNTAEDTIKAAQERFYFKMTKATPKIRDDSCQYFPLVA